LRDWAPHSTAKYDKIQLSSLVTVLKKKKIEIIFDNYFNIKESELIKKKVIYICSVFLIYYLKNIEIHSKKYYYFYVLIRVF